MSQQDSTRSEPGLKEKLETVVSEQSEKVKNSVPEDVRQQGERVLSVVSEVPNKVDVLKVVSTIALVGILINNRRSLKFSKQIVKNMDKNMVEVQNTIKALKEAGQTFTFYPGVGLWVD